MAAGVCTRARLIALAAAAIGGLVAPRTAVAQGTPATFKVAFFNIQSGKGEPAMTGHVADFSDTTNCTDTTQPINAWGIGLIQDHLRNSIGADSRIVALGLAESWASVCGSPENVRKALGWAARSSERNGVAMVARYGFAGAEEWVQLDTTLNTNQADTMWVLRVPVCLDSACTQSINVFAAHWFASGSYRSTSYDRQGQGTAAFLQRAGGSAPHVLVGDLNVWEGVAACGQSPINAGLSYLRDAGYVDAWPAIHGTAEGFTGMTNRTGCGVPEGYTWKRIDYAWSPGDFRPLNIERWAMVTPGDGSPSDHYGVVAEYPWPGTAPVSDTTPPSVTVSSPINGASVSGTVSISVSASDDVAVSRVEILEDNVVAQTLTATPYQASWDTTKVADGAHTIAARAYDAAGNVGSSAATQVYVQQPVVSSTAPSASATEIVLYAKDASAVQGNWILTSDAGAAGGARMSNPDAGAAKLASALAAPANYFELTFDAQAGTPYRLWIRGRAERDYWGNDSVFVQFSGSVDQAGAPTYRIGTTAATWVNLEDCSGCGISGWGWQDNGYGAGVLGPLVSFATTGPQTIRIQPREDGFSIDQVVLSSSLYLTQAPGTLKLDGTILQQTTSAATVDRTEIVMLGSSVSTVAGAWRVLSDSTAAHGVAVGHPDAGAAKLSSALASPVNYVEFTFDAEAGQPYHLWIRGRADRDYWGNDSVFVQFSNAVDAAGAPVLRIGSTDAATVNLEDAVNAGLSGWGWQDNGYGTGVLGPAITFGTTGPQTIRIQTREDGLRIDQVVLSAEKYLTVAPGALKNDSTILK